MACINNFFNFDRNNSISIKYDIEIVYDVAVAIGDLYRVDAMEALIAAIYLDSDFNTTNSALFFTRFITHYCAPIFVFLAGTAAYLYGRNKTKKTLFNYLFSRGIWLIFLEIFLNNFLWRFETSYKFIVIQVLWAIGFSAFPNAEFPD